MRLISCRKQNIYAIFTRVLAYNSWFLFLGLYNNRVIWQPDGEIISPQKASDKTFLSDRLLGHITSWGFYKATKSPLCRSKQSSCLNSLWPVNYPSKLYGLVHTGVDPFWINPLFILRVEISFIKLSSNTWLHQRLVKYIRRIWHSGFGGGLAKSYYCVLGPLRWWRLMAQWNILWQMIRQ